MICSISSPAGRGSRLSNSPPCCCPSLSVLEASPLTTSIPNYRLWFQLTRTIESFFAVPSSQPFRIDLYEQFIRDFGGKLDPLKHAAIAVSVARSYEGERRCS